MRRGKRREGREEGETGTFVVRPMDRRSPVDGGMYLAAGRGVHMQSRPRKQTAVEGRWPRIQAAASWLGDLRSAACPSALQVPRLPKALS